MTAVLSPLKQMSFQELISKEFKNRTGDCSEQQLQDILVIFIGIDAFRNSIQRLPKIT